MTFVFDLDGTLIDSSRRHWVLMEALLRDDGVDVPEDFPETYMAYKREGFSGLAYLKDRLGLDPQRAGMIQRQWIAHIEDACLLELDHLYPDALPACARIRESGGRICVLTMRRNRAGVAAQLRALGLEACVERCDVIDPGASPDAKGDVLADIAHGARECLMVGDTEIDYRAACRAGVPCYLLNRGFRSAAYWARFPVQTHDDLTQLPVAGSR